MSEYPFTSVTTSVRFAIVFIRSQLPFSPLLYTGSARLSPVVVEQRQTDAYEGQQQVQREQVGVVQRPAQLGHVVRQQRERDHHRLAHLQTVHPRQDVDGVGAEHRQHAHVHVVQRSCGRERGRSVEGLDIQCGKARNVYALRQGERKTEARLNRTSGSVLA